MEYKILDTSSFNGIIYKIELQGIEHFIGVANYEEGCDIYFPEAGVEYTLIMLNNSIYRFLSTEFAHPCSISYIAEKLGCDEQLAKFVYHFVQDMLTKDAAKLLLLNQYDNKNPFVF